MSLGQPSSTASASESTRRHHSHVVWMDDSSKVHGMVLNPSCDSAGMDILHKKGPKPVVVAEEKLMEESPTGQMVAARSKHLEAIGPWKVHLPAQWQGMQLQGPADWFSLPFYMDCVFYTLLRLWRIGLSDVRAEYAEKAKEFDYQSEEDLWFDWVADTGDGFNPCLAVAQLIAKAPGLQVDGLDLPRGRVLVHGGDLCYPWPQDIDRFLDVMTLAAPASAGDAGPDLFMIPGNHEWTDGLHRFHELLQRPTLSGWRFPQQTSYFVLRLSGWLVYALDVVEDSDMADIDDAQFEFFENHARQHTSERVLLMTHTPDTMKSSTMGLRIPERLSRLREILGERHVLHIAGDVHYYRRYEAAEEPPCTLLISGSGGAFSHSPSVPEASCFTSGGRSFLSATSYPTPAEFDRQFSSKALFMVHRGVMSYLGLMYAGMVAAALPASAEGFWGGAQDLWSQCVHGQSYTFHASAVVLFVIHTIFSVTSETGGVGFALRALSLAVGHTGVHIMMCFALRAALELLLVSLLSSPAMLPLLAYRVGMVTATYFFGGLLGNAVYNLYFYVTFLVFRIHWNEACSHITHEDHRSFLRMRVTPQGDLDIYVVGVEKVPDRWIGGQQLEPESPLAPHLVEHIHIPAAAVSCGKASAEGSEEATGASRRLPQQRSRLVS